MQDKKGFILYADYGDLFAELSLEKRGVLITYIFDYVKPDQGCILVSGRLHCMGDAKGILKTVKKHGYEWCITCERKKPRRKSSKPKK